MFKLATLVKGHLSHVKQNEREERESEQHTIQSNLSAVKHQFTLQTINACHQNLQDSLSCLHVLSTGHWVSTNAVDHHGHLHDGVGGDGGVHDDDDVYASFVCLFLHDYHPMTCPGNDYSVYYCDHQNLMMLNPQHSTYDGVYDVSHDSSF